MSAPVAAAGAGSFAVSNGSAALNTFGISSIARDGFDFTFTSASGVHTGSSDAVTLNLNNVGGAAPIAAGDAPQVDFRGAAANAGIETINVVATEAARLESLTVEDSAGTQTMTTLNVGGTGTLRIENTLNFKGTKGTIDASGNAGGVTLTVGTEDITFKGGSGDDRLNFATAGDLTAADVVDFGAGTNTLGLADTTITTALYTAINATKANKVAFTAGITADLSKLTSSVVVVDNDVAGNTFTKLEATDVVEVTTNAANTTTVDLTATLGYNTANVKLAGTASGDVDMAGLTTANQTIVNIESVGASGTVNDIGGITNTANTAITITGSGSGLTVGTLAASAVLKATDYTGSTFSVTGANAASSFETGSARDTITLGTLAGGDIVKTGAGSDTIKTAAVTGTTATVITAGLGADTINVAKAGAAVNANITMNVSAEESYASAGQSDIVVFTSAGAAENMKVTLNTGVLSTSLTAATSVTVGTTKVAEAGGFVWVNTAGATSAQNQDAALYQDSNGNGVIDASDLKIDFDLNGNDTFAITIVGGQAVVDFVGV